MTYPWDVLVMLEALFGQVCQNTKTESPRDFGSTPNKYPRGVPPEATPETESNIESTQKGIRKTSQLERPTAQKKEHAPLNRICKFNSGVFAKSPSCPRIGQNCCTGVAEMYQCTWSHTHLVVVFFSTCLFVQQLCLIIVYGRPASFRSKKKYRDSWSVRL